MTRKETEKQVREHMQQTISDKEALWAKIESRLPEQKPAEQPASKLHRSVLRNVMGVAACFLFAAVGASLWTQHQHMETATNKFLTVPADDGEYRQDAAGNGAHFSTTADLAEEGDNYNYEYEGEEAEEAEAPAAEQSNAAVPKAEESSSGTLTYADLDLSGSHAIADSVDRTLLAADSAFFSLAEVLEQTECFADVLVLDGQQDTQTGDITYFVQVLTSYGEESLPEVLALRSSSPYLMESSHKYVLPLCRDESGWVLANDSAPQMERTLDDKVLIHNGWYLFTENSVPVLCAQSGTDDYFYDRMCLINAETLESFLNDRTDGSFE